MCAIFCSNFVAGPASAQRTGSAPVQAPPTSLLTVPYRVTTRPATLKMAQAGEKRYVLSCEILSHSADVRAVCSVRLQDGVRDHVVTASRDGTACVWKPDPSSPSQYLLQKVIRQHTGYVSALCVIPPDLSCGRDRRKFVNHALR